MTIMRLGIWIAVAMGCLFGGIATPAAARPDNPQAQRLQQQLQDAAAKEDWPAAIKAGLALHPIDPRGGATAFNLALVYSQSGDAKAAAEWLVTAGKDGFAGLTVVSTTPELIAVRFEPRYQDALALIRANRAKQMEAFQAEAATHEPLVVLPPRHDPSKPAPLIIALHGTGGRGKEMAEAWKAVAAKAGAILICPDALRPTGNGYHWKFVDESEWLVQHTVEWARSKYAIDAERMVLTGFSQGANVSLQVSTKHPDLFQGVIVCCGHYEPHAQPLPEKPAAMPRYALLTGEHDEGAESNREFARQAGALGAAVDLHIYKNHGHALPPNRDREFAAALEFVLKH